MEDTLFQIGVGLAAALAGVFSYLANRNASQANKAVNSNTEQDGRVKPRIYDLVIRMDERQRRASTDMDDVKATLRNHGERLSAIEKKVE